MHILINIRLFPHQIAVRGQRKGCSGNPSQIHHVYDSQVLVLFQYIARSATAAWRWRVEQLTWGSEKQQQCIGSKTSVARQITTFDRISLSYFNLVTGSRVCISGRIIHPTQQMIKRVRHASRDKITTRASRRVRISSFIQCDEFRSRVCSSPRELVYGGRERYISILCMIVLRALT